jgi:uncharacterized protein (DUF58 family)
MRFGTRVRFKSVQAARAAALLAWMAAAGGDRVGALGFGGGVNGEVKPASGRRGLLHVLRALRDWDANADGSLQEPLSRGMSRLRRLLRPGMRLVLLTDGFSTDAEAAQLLPQLAGRHEIAVVLLRDALELQAPPPGRYALHLGAARRILDFSDRDVRTAWAERFAASREELRALCKKLGLRVIDLDGHGDLRRSLAPLLARSRHSAVVA